MLVKHDGREDHIYGTGDDRKVISVGSGGSDDSSADTSTDTSSTTGSTSEKAPSSEKTKPVEGRAYADITAGPRKDLYLNTSGNARDGKTFVLVKKEDREYHIYGTGKNRQVFGVKIPTAASSTDSTTAPSTTTDSTAPTGDTTSGSLVTSNPTS
ncbi:MAG TPA: hypothetical protein VI300_29115 [Solirubrobacter sp.]